MENLKKLNGFNVIGLMCFLVMIFTCLNPNVAQAEVDKFKIAIYAQDLRNLYIDPKASGKSIIGAKDLYFKTFNEQDSPETRDAAFFMFNKFYLKILENAYKDEIYYNLNNEYKEENHPDVIKVKEIIALQGLQLVNKEGDYYPYPDANYLAKTFGKFVSPAIRAYLTFSKKNENLVDDGMLIVNFDELREIIILGDSVLKKYPDSDIASKVKSELYDVLYLYLLGFGPEVVVMEGTSSYEKFLKENKSSTYYPLVKHVYDLWKQNKFKYNDNLSNALLAKLRKDGILPMPNEN